MSNPNFHPFTPEELAAAANNRLYNKHLKQFLFFKMQRDRGIYGPIGQWNLDRYQFCMDLAYQNMVSLCPQKAKEDAEFLNK